jgi:hypothetical protein
MNGNYAMVEMMLRAGAPLNAPLCGSAIRVSVEHGREALVRLLSKHGAQVAMTDFVAAAEYGHMSLMRLLLPLVPANDRPDALRSAMVMAARRGRVDAVVYLLTMTTDVNQEALRLSAMNGMFCVRMLFNWVQDMSKCFACCY